MPLQVLCDCNTPHHHVTTVYPSLRAQESTRTVPERSGYSTQNTKGNGSGVNRHTSILQSLGQPSCQARRIILCVSRFSLTSASAFSMASSADLLAVATTRERMATALSRSDRGWEPAACGVGYVWKLMDCWEA